MTARYILCVCVRVCTFAIGTKSNFSKWEVAVVLIESVATTEIKNGNCDHIIP